MLWRRFFPLVLLFSAGCAHRGQELCDHILLKEGKLSLSRNERVLVCGAEKGAEGWKRIPLPQSQYHISVFLQQEGYLHPRFERDGDQLNVWSGPRERISDLSVQIDAAPGLIDAGKKRQIVGEPLTPAKLDEVEQWADTKLRSMGYPCPKVDVTAQAWDQKVLAVLNPGPRQNILSIERLGFEKIDEEALLRYEAFKLGQLYDVRKTQMTASRLLADGLIQSAYFGVTCDPQGVLLKMNGSVGPPKLFRFEVGASTEQFPFTDITFKNTRLDSAASSFTAILHASPRNQSLSATSQLYVLPGTERTYVGPRGSIGRTSERSFEYIEAKAGADIGRMWDSNDIRWGVRGGPTVNFVKTLEGVGPDDVYFLSWEGGLKATSHAYEISTRNQYEGWEGSFDYRGQRKGLGSEINVDRFDLRGKMLWNIGSFTPPLFVLGARMELSNVEADRVIGGSNNQIIPLDYRIFYGGGDNLRGFSRKVLGNQGFGYFSSAYLGLELRLVEELPWNLQPFGLFDIAQLGDQQFDLGRPLFTSSGAGMRWASPFGTVRGSAARGRIFRGDLATSGYPQEWVFFFSFGQEF